MNQLDESASLKGLERIRTTLLKDTDRVKEQIRACNQELSAINQKIREVDDKIASLKRKCQNIVISEHAILRYLERVKGMDLDAIRAEILPENIKIHAQNLGSGTYPCGPTHKVKIKGGTVITVFEKESKS